MIFKNAFVEINQHILFKNIATWCLVTLRLHRCGFKTAEQDTKSTRPSTVGLPKVIPRPGYPRPCPMSCITPPLAVLSGRAWWPFMGTSTVSCRLLFRHVFIIMTLMLHTFCKDFTTFFLCFCVFSRSSLLRPDLSESPSSGHVAAPAPPQPLALHHNPHDP